MSCCFVLYCIALHCITLRCVVLCCAALRCVVLRCGAVGAVRAVLCYVVLTSWSGRERGRLATKCYFLQKRFVYLNHLIYIFLQILVVEPEINKRRNKNLEIYGAFTFFLYNVLLSSKVFLVS